LVTKRSSDFNEVTGLPAGSPLPGASFEIYNTTGNIVDKMVSDSRGIAASKLLPTGMYFIKEVSAPRYYALSQKEMFAEIKHNGDIIRFEVFNESITLDLTIQKKGPNQAAPGQMLIYEIYGVANNSSVALENFYIHDRIPTDATRLAKVVTGTYSERMYYKRMYYKLTYKTNYHDYRVLAENLLTKNSYEYSLHPNKKLSEPQLAQTYIRAMGNAYDIHKCLKENPLPGEIIADIHSEINLKPDIDKDWGIADLPEIVPRLYEKYKNAQELYMKL